MANSLSAEVWLDERRWDALEKALKARGTDIEQHLQDYLMKLSSETVAGGAGGGPDLHGCPGRKLRGADVHFSLCN